MVLAIPPHSQDNFNLRYFMRAPFAIPQPTLLTNLRGGVVLIWILSAGQRQDNTRNR
jgi:hypothetical protein